MHDAVILSDLHLGSNNCEAKKITHFLERIADGDIQTRQLILNGDVFDSFDFRRLSKKKMPKKRLIVVTASTPASRSMRR